MFLLQYSCHLLSCMSTCGKITYHKDGLATRLGLGRVLARLGEPEGDELRVSTLGSSSSISSTSSCRSTSWSRMHLTEYCPKTLSCVATKRIQWGDAFTIKPDVCFERQRSSTYQLLLQLVSFSCLMKRAPGPQSLNQSPKPCPLQVTEKWLHWETNTFISTFRTTFYADK